MTTKKATKKAKVESQTQQLDTNLLEHLTSEMDRLHKERAECKFVLKNLEQEITKNEMRLQAILRQFNVNEMNYGVYSFGWQHKVVNRLNQSLLKEQYPDQYNACYLPSESDVFVFKIN